VQHTHPSDGGEIKIGPEPQEQPQQVDNQRTDDDLPVEAADGYVFFQPAGISKGDGNAYNKQEKGKDQVGDGTTVPLGMPEGR
jgi:hypothetical protein